MTELGRMLLFMVSCVFTQNVVFARLLGGSALLRQTGTLKTAAAVGLQTTLALIISAAGNWLVARLVLAPLHLDSLSLIAFAVVIAGSVALAGALFRRACPKLGDALNAELPLLGAGTLLLAASMTAADGSFIEAVLGGLFLGLGFLLALVLMAGVQERLEFSKIPQPLKGYPISLISASLMALAFMGFAGIGG